MTPWLWRWHSMSLSPRLRKWSWRKSRQAMETHILDGVVGCVLAAANGLQSITMRPSSGARFLGAAFEDLVQSSSEDRAQRRGQVARRCPPTFEAFELAPAQSVRRWVQLIVDACC
mmetsp:Transcript_33017/g.60877  ORF Transcript_33017/g.60877 Transcript_33017/m.60877 type:complete len:116 (-) Transcript_33017:101-448(-)